MASILLVEDDDSQVFIVETLLQEMDPEHTVKHVEDSACAKNYIRSYLPCDLAIIDICLPGSTLEDGVQLGFWIKSEFPHIKIIIRSASEMVGQVGEECRDYVLSKSVDLDVFEGVITKCLEGVI